MTSEEDTVVCACHVPLTPAVTALYHSSFHNSYSRVNVLKSAQLKTRFMLLLESCRRPSHFVSMGHLQLFSSFCYLVFILMSVSINIQIFSFGVTYFALLFRNSFIFILCVLVIFFCVCICASISDNLELELQTDVSQLVGASN